MNPRPVDNNCCTTTPALFPEQRYFYKTFLIGSSVSFALIIQYWNIKMNNFLFSMAHNIVFYSFPQLLGYKLKMEIELVRDRKLLCTRGDPSPSGALFSSFSQSFNAWLSFLPPLGLVICSNVNIQPVLSNNTTPYCSC